VRRSIFDDLVLLNILDEFGNAMHIRPCDKKVTYSFSKGDPAPLTTKSKLKSLGEK
jgi:hypothetical protein